MSQVMKPHYYILIAVCSYLFFVLAGTPAAKVIALANNNFNLPVKFHGVQGSVWNGQIDSLTVNSQRIEQIQWSINPAALLLASLTADIQANIKNQRLTGRISVNMNGNIQAKDVHTKISAAEVQQLIAMPLGELGGDFSLNIESLHWQGAGLPATTATIKWRNAKLTLVDSVDLGQMLINIRPDDKGGLAINMSNSGGVISIDGTIQLSDKKQYTLLINFKPSSHAKDNIKQSLAMFARRQSNGSYRLKQNGNLSQFGL
jgi:general secretion pathway protein N